MKPYYQDATSTIYLGDCRDVIPDLEADAVVTDPPYGVKIADWDESVPHDVLPALLPFGPVLWCGSSPHLVDDVTVMRPERTLIWAAKFRLGGARKNGIAYRWQPIYCWNLPKTHDGPTFDFLDTAIETGNNWYHPGTKPVRLFRRLVGIAAAGAVVLDPFMGSGTTLRAAKDMGRRSIGIDLSEAFCEIAAQRLSQEVLALELPAPLPDPRLDL